MDVSFIVLTWNSARYVEECLASVAGALAASRYSYEIRVFDNGSRDGTPAALARWAAADPSRVFAHYESTNVGTTRSRNVLCRAALGRYLCFIDSDVVLQRGAVESLIEVLEQDASLGVVVPRIVYPDGRWQKSFDRFPTIVDKAHRFFRLREIETRERLQLQNVTRPFDVDYAISAFWLLRRELLETVGFLDENIFYAPEDVDYCLRVWQAGYRIRYVPTVSVTHHTQEISRGFKINKAKLNHVRGLLYYFRKHRYLLRRPSPARRIAAVAGEQPTAKPG